MADNLIFPIGFDLQKAVEKAGQDWDKTYAKKLETYLAKRPIKVELNFENLTDVKARLAQLKIDPITPETKASIKELARELQVLAKALEQVQKYSKNPAQLGQQNFRNDVQLEKLRQANERLEIQKRRVALAEQKHAEAMKRSASASKQLSSEYQTQEGYISRLVKRLAVYASFSAVGGFLQNIREVTAQFELQRISLGAILQDQNKANQLFSQIKTFALTSPVKILDLTKYTKQLAAYKIGYDELFETTKRLTDVSVGLGVSMDRVVLAYGQVRATGHLRASEIRQFTEMGVPIVEELAAKLSKLNGETVTAAQVMDMVSKRAISFDMVKDVFNDMTSAGGIFYNMQEKQGNTLYGMWAKLGDAASVMYEQIGNTEAVNSAMKGTIQLLTTLMRNWKATAFAMTAAGVSAAVGFAANKFINKGGIAGVAESYRTKMDEKATAATQRRIQAVQRLASAQQSGTPAEIRRADAALKTAVADEQAAIAARQRASAMKDGQAAMRGIGSTLASIGSMAVWGVVLAAVSAWVYEFKRAWDEAHRLKNKLKEIETETAVLQAQDVRNFERVADAALAAPTGSKAQQEKLRELQQTYRDVFDEETLTIENLHKIAESAEEGAEKYGKLTIALREYIAEQQRQKALNAIQEEIQPKINEHMKELRKALERKGYGFGDQAAFTLNLTDISNEAEWAGKTVEEKIREALRRSGIKGSEELIDELMKGSRWDRFVRGMNNNVFGNLIAGGKSAQMAGLDPDKINGSVFGYLLNWTADTEEHANALNEAFTTMNATIDAQNRNFDVAGGTLAEYNNLIKQTKESIDKYSFKSKENTVDRDNETINMQVDYWLTAMQKAFDEAGIEIDLSDYVYLNEEGFKNVDWTAIDSFIRLLDTKLAVPLGGLSEHIQNQFSRFIPSGKFVQHFRDKLYKTADTLGVARGLMRDYLMNSGEDFESYQKRIKDAIDKIKKNIALLKETIKMDFDLKIADARKNGDKQEEARLKREKEQMIKEQKELEERLKVLERINEENEKINPSGKNKGRKSDTRLQSLQEMWRTLKEINKQYDDLAKKEGKAQAAADIKKDYAPTLKLLNKLANKKVFGLNFDFPLTPDSLQQYGKQIIDKIKALKLKGGDKAVVELQLALSKEAQAQTEKRIEAQLKAIQEKVSRTKTAKEFYEKILSTTGNVDMAINLTTSIFGENGQDLNKQIALQINELMQSGEGGIEIGLDVVGDGYNINYKNLRKLTEEAYKAKKIGDQAYKDLIAIADNGEKDVSKMVDGWLKATEKAKIYSDKLLDLARTTNAEIAKIEAQRTAGNITDDYAKVQIQGYKDKQAQEIAKLQYEAFKDSPMYVQMFDDLDNASTTMLRNMKQRIEELKTSWKDLTPTQLKEMQSRLNEIDAQLAKRNPFKGLIDGIKEYRNLRKGGDALGNKSEGAAEKALDAAAKARLEAEKEYLEILNKEGATQEEIAAAKKRFDDAAADEDAAAKAVENWKKVKDAIGLSANELFQMLNWAGDIARGIADISEAMGADEEDVQYWNDVADALGEISGGIQDIVQSAMSGNVVGIISSTLTAIPKMFVGFANLFSAGKIKRANKEIKRQQELLEQLEYTYGRLEKAAERAFAGDYLSNYRQQIKNLQAQQTAYLRMAEAERSKGKDEDAAKTEEYLKKARDIADKIADMQNDLAAQIVGSDIASMARDFVQAWWDAYKEFGNTTDAMGKKFKEMIDQMAANSVIAQVMKRALEPTFKMINEMKEGDFYSTDFWERLSAEAQKGAENGAHGAEVVVGMLQKAGISLREAGSDYTGIAKNIAGATSEEINTAAAIGNTLMYYVSPIPRIDENLARVVAIMEGGSSTPLPASGGSGTADYTAMFLTANEHLSSLPRMEQHLSEIHRMLGRVIATNGSRTGINAFIR